MSSSWFTLCQSQTAVTSQSSSSPAELVSAPSAANCPPLAGDQEQRVIVEVIPGGVAVRSYASDGSGGSVWSNAGSTTGGFGAAPAGAAAGSDGPATGRVVGAAAGASASVVVV